MDGNRLVGKVNPRHQVCYLPHNGQEVILVIMIIITIIFIVSDDSHIKNSDIFVSDSSVLLLSAHPSSLKSTINTLTGEFLAEQDSIGGPVSPQNIKKN